MALAKQLAQLGVRDLEKLSTGSTDRYTGGDSRAKAGELVNWGTYRGAPFETYSYLSYDGKPIGYIPRSPNATSIKADPYDPNGVGILNLWDPAGKGHVKFIPTAQGPGDLVGFTPQWGSSSDIPSEVVAVLGVALTLSGVGAALGGAITSSLGLTASAATNALIGNTLVQTVLNGGDIGEAVKGSLASWAGAQVGGYVGNAAKSLFSNPDGLRLISNVANQATRAAILGRDVESAVKNTIISGAVDFATAKIPNFGSLPKAVQDTVRQSINAAVQGKDIDAGTMLANAAKEGLLSYGLSQVPGFNDADARTKSFVTTMLRTAIDQGDLSQSAINWAVGQAQQELQKVIKVGPALDELKKAGLIPEASYFGLDDRMKQLVDNFAQQSDPKAAAARYVNSLSTTDTEIRQMFKELTGRDPTEEDRALLARFTGGLDEATARTGLDNQIRADAAANELRFDRLQSVLTNSKSTEQDLANVMNEYGITPAFIERVTGRKYDEISGEIASRSRPPVQETVPGSAAGATTTGTTTGTATGTTTETATDSGAATTTTAGAGQTAPFDFSKLNITHENQRRAAEVIRQELGDAALNDPNWIRYLNEGGLSAAASNIFAGTEQHLREQLRLIKSGQSAALGLPQDALTRQLAAGYDIGDYRAPAGFSIGEAGAPLGNIGYTAAGVPINLIERIEITGRYLPTESGEVAKNVMDAVKGTWLEGPAAMGVGALGELGQTFAGGASWFFNLPATHSLNRAFNEITQAAETGVPQDVKDQWKNWRENVGKAEGFWGTLWAGMRSAPDNFKGILWETGKEILQELPTLGVGLLVRGTAAGLSLAEKTAARLGVSVATAMEMLENGGAAYNEAVSQTLQRLEPLIREGKMTREEALYIAHGNGGEALLYGAGITGIISRVPGGNTLIEQIVGGNRFSGAANLAQSIATAATTGGKSAVKEFFSEGFEEGLTDAGTQYAVTGQVNPQQAAYAAITGAFIGGTATGSLSTLDSLRANLQNAYAGQDASTVIGINPSTGREVTLGETLQVLDTKRQELGGTTEAGAAGSAVDTSDSTVGTSAGTVVDTGAGTAPTTTTPSTTVDAGGTVVDTTAGSTTANTTSDGATIVGDIAGGTAGGTTAGGITAGGAAGTTAGGTTAGVDTTTSAAAAGTAAEGTTETLPGAGTAGVVLDTRGGTAPGTTAGATTTGTTTEVTTGATSDTTAGTSAGTTADTTAGGATTAATSTGGDVAQLTTADVTKIVNDAIAANPGLQATDVQNIVSQALANIPAGLTTADVNNAISTALAGLPAGVTAQQVQNTVSQALSGYATRRDIENAIAGIQFPAGLTTADVTNIVSNALAANPGLTLADVQGVVTQALSSLPAGLNIADVNTAISTALSGLPAGVTPEQMQQAIGSAVSGLSTSVTQQIGDLRTNLTAAIDAAKASGLQGDAALQSGLNAVAASVGTTKQELLTQLGTTEQGLRTEFASQIGGVQTQVQELGTSLSAAIDAARAEGLQGDQALQQAIDKVAQQSNQSRDQVLSQLGKTEQQLRSDFSTQLSGVTTALEQQTQQQQEALTNVESRLDARIEQLMQTGMTQQQATQQAIQETNQRIADVQTGLSQDIATGQQQTQQQIQEQTQQQQQALTNVETRLDARINQLMQQGMDQQLATRTAIDEIDRELELTRTQFGEQLTGLGGEFAAYRTQVAEQEAARQQQARQAAEQSRSQNMMQQALTMMGVGAAAGPVENYYAKFRDPLTTRVTQDKFESPLDAFLKQVEVGSYTDPFKPTKPQEQPDRISGEQQMPDYFNYGQVNEIDDLLRLPEEQMSGLPYRSGGFVPGYAEGGIVPAYAGGGALPVVPFAGKHRVDFRHGSAVHGPGDGQSDDIPAMLADGEYVFDAETVAALGNGSTKAGADRLDKMRLAIRKHKRSGPLDEIPPPSKSPLEYLSEGSRFGKKGKK
jgi:hypothetical protein